MPTKPKTDALSLRKRVHSIIAKDIRAVEAAQKKTPGAQLDAKTAAQMVAYAKALNEQLTEEEMWARKMLSEAAKLNVLELVKRAQEGAGQAEEGDDEGQAEDSADSDE